MNEKSLKFWEELAQKTKDPYSVKLASQNDFTDIDAKFILTHCTPNSEILDLATGTGLTVNKIYKKIKHITAVEKFINYTNFIEKSENIEIVNEDIKDFTTDKKFDLITMFGIVSYFNETEIQNIYRKYKQMLKDNGKIIVKNQFGVEEDVLIEGYSKELETDYFSDYRHIEKEKTILQNLGFQNVTLTDIYPPECNRWDNTHFYAITAEV